MTVLLGVRTHLGRNKHRYHAALTLLLVLTNTLSFASGVVAHDRVVALGGALFSHRKHVAPNSTYVLKGAGAASWSLAAFMSPPQDQGQVLACGAFAATEAAYAELRERGEIPPDLSPWHTYWYATGGANVPTSLDQEAQALGGHGAVPYADYPAFGGLPAGLHPRAAGWTYEYLFYQPAGTASGAAIRGAILAGHPVVLLMQVNGELLGDFGGQARSDNAGAYQFTHFVVAYGFDSAGVWIQNSWGPRFGVGGRIELSYSAVESSVLAAGILHPGAIGWPPSAIGVRSSAFGQTATAVPTATAHVRPPHAARQTPTMTTTTTPAPLPTATRTPNATRQTPLFRVIHAQQPRLRPDAGAGRLPLVPAGRYLGYAGRRTPHWVVLVTARRPRLLTAWFLASNVRCSRGCRLLRP